MDIKVVVAWDMKKCVEGIFTVTFIMLEVADLWL
jgi:hypothetical protein